MPGWYVRRGEKVVGPVETAKLKELATAGKVLATDQLAKDAAGPWTAAGRTSLFATAKPLATQVVTQPAIVPKVEPIDAPLNGSTKKSRVGAVVAVMGRGTLAAGGAAMRSLSNRSQRRHELKLAKIQAKAIEGARQPVAAPATQAVAAPSINITNVNTVIGASQTSSKSRFTAAFIALLFGYLGFHKFYLGESGGGLFRLLLSCTGVGLIVTIPWAILDFFGLLFMSEQTFSRRFA